MDEVAVRLVVVAGIAGAASVAAMLARRGRAWRRRVFEPSDLRPGVHLFSSEGCSSCARARASIEEAGLSFFEHTYEQEAELLDENGITRVPTVAWVPVDGGAGWAAEGIPSTRALVRWLGP